MSILRRLFYIVFLAVFFDSAFGKSACEKSLEKKFGKASAVKNHYAKKFELVKYKSLTYLTIKKKSYLLGGNANLDDLECHSLPFIKTPIKRLTTNSTTHLAYIDALDEVTSLKGFSGGKYVYNEKIRRLLNSGIVASLGYPTVIEKLLKQKGQVHLTYPLSSTEICNKIKKFHIPCLELVEYEEEHPLGRAEWINIFGVLFSKEKKSRELFLEIMQNYQTLRKKLSKKKKPVKVIVGEVINGLWQAAGGKSYLAQMIQDAGGAYVFKDHTSNKTKTLKIEELITLFQNKKIDFWLPQNNWKKMGQSLKTYRKYKYLPFYKNSLVFNNSKKIAPLGGNDYYESAVVRPDWVLRDLAQIFYPLDFKHPVLRWYLLLN